MPFEFSHEKDLTAADLPSQQAAVQAALELVKQVKIQWTKSKQYHDQGQVVHTYNTRRANDFWMARVSHHPAFKGSSHRGKGHHHHVLNDDDITFDVFKKYVLENHTQNELQYIPLLDAYRSHTDEPDIIPPDSPEGWQAFTVHYKFPKLFSDREMAVWVLAVQPDPAVKQFLVISLPAVHAVSPAVTRAVYCAIEVVTYKEEEGHVEWVMAQTSDARGSIPRWIQDKSVTASVASDVPCFIAWASKQVEAARQSDANTTSDKQAVIDAAVEKAASADAQNNSTAPTTTTTGAL